MAIGRVQEWIQVKLNKGYIEVDVLNEVSQYYQAVETPETEPKCKGTESE